MFNAEFFLLPSNIKKMINREDKYNLREFFYTTGQRELREHMKRISIIIRGKMYFLYIKYVQKQKASVYLM